ncbi:hypothetical protein SERLA73DRAFT_18539, partial [Serpula lacrymans var. lacrymans S7.3]
HASACNVIECIFGILKRRFCILLLPSEYDMAVQACIPPALCMLHNFIRVHDPYEIQDYNTPTEDPIPRLDTGTLATGPPTEATRTQANVRKDEIAKLMWEDYQGELR